MSSAVGCAGGLALGNPSPPAPTPAQGSTTALHHAATILRAFGETHNAMIQTHPTKAPAPTRKHTHLLPAAGNPLVHLGHCLQGQWRTAGGEGAWRAHPAIKVITQELWSFDMMTSFQRPQFSHNDIGCGMSTPRSSPTRCASCWPCKQWSSCRRRPSCGWKRASQGHPLNLKAWEAASGAQRSTHLRGLLLKDEPRVQLVGCDGVGLALHAELAALWRWRLG